MIRGILSEDIETVWPEVEPLIAKACEYSDGKITTDDIYKDLKTQDMQLWLIPKGVWVTRIVDYPQSRRLEVVSASGEWDNWLEYGEVVADWARSLGCDAAEIIGRKGWGRKTGFEEIHRTFRVKL